MADLQRTVGTVIRRERERRRLTLKEMAERSIVSPVYLGEIERGKKYPSALVLEHVAEALEITAPDLLDLVARDLRADAAPRVESHVEHDENIEGQAQGVRTPRAMAHVSAQAPDIPETALVVEIEAFLRRRQRRLATEGDAPGADLHMAACG